MELYPSPKKLFKVIRGGYNYAFYGRRGNYVESVERLETYCQLDGPITSTHFWRNVLMVKGDAFVYSYSRVYPQVYGVEKICWNFSVLYPCLNKLRISRMTEGCIYTSDGEVFIWSTK